MAQSRGYRGLSSLGLARLLALLVPALLLAGAWGSQIWGGLFPCEMCWWQRYAHLAALVLACCAYAFARRPGADRLFLRLAALAIAASGCIGAYQAGVEAHIFEGLTRCTATATGATGDALIAQIMSAPIIRCDVVQWRFLGVSMAGWNAILSIGFAGAILWLSSRRPRTYPRSQR